MSRKLIYLALMISAPGFTGAMAASPQPLSKYGQIQNVDNYSSNPFWDRNGPYNQKFPTPVYVQGTDLNAADCQSIVASLVAAQCAAQNNCAGKRLSDIRPAIMLQLSRMPGHNYASACAGYIDTAFDNYMAQYSYVTPSAGTAFPSPTVANPNANAQPYKPANPYAVQLPAAPGDPWAANMIERASEMKQLQAQNGATAPKIGAAQFESTAADLSFTERMENLQAGYEPFKDKKVYTPLKIESDEDYAQRKQRLEALKAQNNTEQNNQTNPDKNPPANNGGNDNQPPSNNNSDRQKLVDAIMRAFKGN